MQKYEVKSLAEMQAWANDFASDLSPRLLVLLKGDLGAGKTTLVTMVVKALALPAASSPTYALHQHYEANNMVVDHFDLYRLQDQSDLESVGFFDVLAAEDNIIFVEWSEKLDTNHLPLDRDILEIKIEIKKEKRVISVRKF